METPKTLFPDSEMVTAQRPTDLTKDQKKAFYAEKAAEIIQNKWSSDDPKSIGKDLKELLYPFNENGYELAKTLENYRAEGTYEIDVEFCEWLDCLHADYNHLVNENVKTWASAHSIAPVFEKGTTLEVVEKLSQSFAMGSKIYVIRIWDKTAKYVLSEKPNDTGGILLPYELVEKACKKIEPIQESETGD